ncbi:MAG: phosphatase PAP2 family protein [Candidatus Neomarinimicrobiota bacterium]
MIDHAYPVVVWLQQFDYQILIYIMQGITFLGNETFFIIIFPTLLWCWKKELGIPLTLSLFGAFLLNIILKEAFIIPRPPQEFWRVPVDGYGFPSGHAQLSMVLWGYLAWRLKNYSWPALLIFFIGFSRIYLGVHSFLDVIGGWIIGFGFLFLAVKLIDHVETMELNFLPIPTALFFPLITGLISILYPHEGIIKISGFVGGIGAGIILEQTYVGFKTESKLSRQALKALFGIGSVVLLRWCLKSILPESEIINWLRYAAVGTWISLGAPWFFLRIKF